MSEIRLKVRQVMERRGLNRYQVNKITGIPYQTLDRYFKNDVTRYDSDVLLKLCIALDCEINDLIEVIK